MPKSDSTADRNTVLQRVHEAINVRLFVNDLWLVDLESGVATEQFLEHLRLWKREADKAGTWRTTELGQQLGSDLLSVFLGVMDPWDVILILCRNGLISETEMWVLEEGLSAGRDAEAVLKRTVQTAYMAYLGWSPLCALN